VLTVAEGDAIVLENGIQISFEPGGVYATGDYWLIPARVAGDGQLDWPLAPMADGDSGPASLPPRGMHHYAALGVTDDAGHHQECCCRFDSLCEQLQAGGKAGAGSASKDRAPVPPGVQKKKPKKPK
jgi:hypothetical protein